MPSFAVLILLMTGLSDSCFCLPVIICQSTTKPPVAAIADNLKNAFRLIFLPVSKSAFINRQNYKDFLSIVRYFIFGESDRIILFYDL